jgi:NAD(P)-dependent dehydrogenase (short-subunit alcohol dehydrogenase family)
MSQNEPVGGERGVIVNAAPAAAHDGRLSPVTAKGVQAGITGMTLTMARGVMSLGVRVAAVAPATGPRGTARPEKYAGLAVAIVENRRLDDGTAGLDSGRRFSAG